MPDGPSQHPGPAAVFVPPSIREAIAAQARAEYPNEACGLMVGDAPAADGGVTRQIGPGEAITS